MSNIDILEPVPPSKTRRPLSKHRHVRQEMARVYRQADCGEIAWGDATRAIYVLHIIAKSIDLEVDELSRLSERAHQQAKDEILEPNPLDEIGLLSHGRRPNAAQRVQIGVLSTKYLDEAYEG